MAPERERTFERPHRPPTVHLCNWVGRRLQQVGLLPDRLTGASVLQTARRQTGLSDFGDHSACNGLDRLLQSCRQDARLNPFGRLVMRRRMVELAANRMKILDDLKRHPEILDVPIRRPLLVTGLPRTGTTLLYNLLAQDPAGRPLLLWEATWPSPPPTTETRSTDPRIKDAYTHVKLAHWLAPRLPAVHTLEPEGPEECLSLTMHTFVSPGFLMLGDVRGYEDWLRQLTFEDKVVAYEFYKRQLQLLQWRIPTGHWVLKSPAHLPGLDALLTVIPDACIVQAHRDPAKAVPSVCSLFAIVRGMGTDELDLHGLGTHAAEFCAELVDRATAARESFPDSVLDVKYPELIENPIGTIHRIYERFGYERSDRMDAKMKQWLVENARDKKPAHRYDLAQFGLDQAMIDRLFGEYRERYEVAREP